MKSLTSTSLFAVTAGFILSFCFTANSQIITTVAGFGSNGYAGDGGPATSAQLLSPGNVVVDGSGNIYISDGGNGIVRKVSTTGIITTFAGNYGNGGGYSGDGGAATVAELEVPFGLAIDAVGNIYISDQSGVVRMVNTSNIISTVAGNYAYGNGYSGDGGPATAAELFIPQGISVDGSGNLFIADDFNNVIRKVNTSGIISTVAGNYSYGSGYSGDGGPATAAELQYPTGVAVDANNNIYITGFNVIREVNTSGIINTIAGNNAFGQGYSGDGGPATAAELFAPMSISIDGVGNVFIADQGNNVLRQVNTSGIISTVVGNYAEGQGYSGDGGQATEAELNSPLGIAIDGSGNVFIADEGNNVIREVNTSGIINTVAGDYALKVGRGYSGDGGPATAAELNYPTGVAIDGLGNIFILDNEDNVIREVSSSTGNINTVAGNHSYGFGYSGDGGPATAAELFDPHGIGTDASGNFYIADIDNNVIRMVNTSGIINTVAGNNAYGFGFSGDGGLATLAEFDGPWGVTVDVSGNIFIPDLNNNVVRKVNTSGIINTIAGNGYDAGSGTGSYSGDGGPATVAELNAPGSVAIDGSGNIYISDEGNNVIRMVNTSGIINTIAGIVNVFGYTGDGGPATAAEFNRPDRLTIDNSGNLFIDDFNNNVVRMMGTTGVITTVAGNSYYGYTGDGGNAIDAELNHPWGVAVDGSDNLFIADQINNRIRKVTSVITSMYNPSIDNNSLFILYPNPAIQTINVEFAMPLQGNAILKVIDLSGRVMLNQQVDNNQTNMHLNISGLSDGMYFMSIENKNTVSMKKFIKLE